MLPLLCVGLCPDWEDWDPRRAKGNAKEAIDAADQWLDVPQVSRLVSVLNDNKICMCIFYTFVFQQSETENKAECIIAK